MKLLLKMGHMTLTTPHLWVVCHRKVAVLTQYQRDRHTDRWTEKCMTTAYTALA